AEEIAPIRVKRIKVPAAARAKVKAALAKNPHVTFVEENYLAEQTMVPNDPSYASQWHLPKIAAPAGWDISTGSSSVDIAILDSGVDPSHPDLAGKLLPGFNFVFNNTDTHDVTGHGTKVAGSAGAMGNNGAGVAGVAWQNQIMPLVIADSTGYATYSRMASAITYAADHGVRIINLSYGGSTSSSTLQNAVNYAWNK
ncbi:peptidase S8 and S53 subtilisin kexin sedolisin, partial [Geobacter metallireducens RCH3]